MGLFGKSKKEKMAELKEKQSMLHGRELKKLLTMFKENRDEIEKRTGKRPDIDDTTKLYMQKVLNVCCLRGRTLTTKSFGMQLTITSSLTIRLNITKGEEKIR